MDPNKTLTQLVWALRENRHSAAVEHLDALIEWLTSGGFEPTSLAHHMSEFYAMSLDVDTTEQLIAIRQRVVNVNDLREDG